MTMARTRRASGAKREPDAELRTPPCHRVGEHALDPHEGQEHGQGSEQAEEDGHEPLLGEQAGERRGHGLHSVHGQVRVQVVNDRADRSLERGRVDRWCAPAGRPALGVWSSGDVDRRRGGLPRPSNLTSPTTPRSGGSRRRIGSAAPIGSRVGRSAARRRLVDEGHGLGVGVVGTKDPPAVQERNTRRGQIVGLTWPHADLGLTGRLPLRVRRSRRSWCSRRPGGRSPKRRPTSRPGAPRPVAAARG